MALATIMTGRINPIQEMNLKTLPMVLFNGVKSATIEYDFAARPESDADFSKVTVNSFVKYKLAIGDVENDNLDKRFKALENAIRYFFWKNVTVIVLFNDKLVFESST